MEKDEFEDILKIDFPNHKVDNDKIITLCRNNKQKEKAFLKLMPSFIILLLSITIFGLIIVSYRGEINKTPYTITSGDKVDTGFFEINAESTIKPDVPIRIGYRIEYSIFNDNESLELEVLIGYFGNINTNGYLYDCELPKIVLRTSDEPIVEYNLREIDIDNFLEKYRLKYVVNEDDHVICGCKYVIPDEAESIKLSVDNEYFSGIFGEIRMGLYVGCNYKAETIYYCKNEEKRTICISNVSLEEAMNKANYTYISGQQSE